jgi:hypothetical protein
VRDPERVEHAQEVRAGRGSGERGHGRVEGRIGHGGSKADRNAMEKHEEREKREGMEDSPARWEGACPRARGTS